MPELAEGKNKFEKSQDTTIISDSAPTGDVGISKTSGDTGIFVYSELPYTIWFKSGGVWAQYKAHASENLLFSNAYRWAPGATHVFFQTSESEHTIYVFGRTGALLIDSTPNNNDNVIDALVLDNASTLNIFGTSDSSVTTVTQHSISDATPITIEDGCDADVVITEVVSDYTDSLSSKLLAYYKFEDNADDSGVSGLHGTASAGCNYVTGRSGMGKALHQTTGEAHVGLRNSEVLNLGADFTVAAWIYVPSVQAATDPVDNPWNDVSVFSNADTFGEWTYVAGINLAVSKPGYSSHWGLHSNALSLYTGCGQGNGIYSWAWYAVSTPANSFPYDEWVHVAVTFAGTDQAGWGGNEKLYINGQVQVLSSRTNQPVQNPMAWTSNVLSANLGAGWRASRPEAHAGSGEVKYDEVAIWKRELSGAEIADLYNFTNGTLSAGNSTSSAAHYKFNGNANNELGGSPATVTGATYVADKDNVGQAISFDGSGDYAILSDDLMNLGNDFTISAWVYADSSDTAPIWAFTNQVYDGTTKMLGIRFGATRAAGAKWNRTNAVAINLPSGNQWSTYSKIADANSLPQDQWAHITVTVEDYETTAPIVKLFVNGVPQTVYDGGSQPSIVSVLEWGDTASSAFVGKLDPPGGPNHLSYSQHSQGETIIWKRALSESEVSELYGAPMGQDLDMSYLTTETVRSDFTVQKQVVVTAPAGTDTTNIKVEITK